MAWFRMSYAKNAFERALAGSRVQDLSPAQGLRAMAAFYRDHRPQHAPAAEGDDVLEFRWGTYDDGYQLSLVRRMRRHGSADPERTLELRYRFRSTPRRQALRDGQQSLDDPAEAAAFVRRVSSSAAWKVAAGASITRWELREA